MASLKYWLWLSSLRGVSNLQKLSLLEHFCEPDTIFFGQQEEYLLAEGMTKSAAAALEDKSLEEAERIWGECDRLGLRILTVRDAEYPDRLRNIFDPPLLLYVQGRLPLFDEEVAIAMVGSRKASPASLAGTERLAFQLANQGALVVSGLARGGDAAAHRGALRAGGQTVAVIGGGHDIVYPRENLGLWEDIAARGAILSEYPPGTPHDGRHFPVRNRIISGLCLATVVSEVPERSGTLITAGRALDQGRDVFALPGPAEDPNCRGSNYLIRDGAGLVTDAWDILSHYAGRYPHKIRMLRSLEPKNFGQNAAEGGGEKPKSEPADTPALPAFEASAESGLTDDQIRIVKTLQAGTMHVDDIIEATQIPARRVLSALTILEIDQIVTQESGKRFRLAVTLLT